MAGIARLDASVLLARERGSPKSFWAKAVCPVSESPIGRAIQHDSVLTPQCRQTMAEFGHLIMRRNELVRMRTNFSHGYVKLVMMSGW